MIFSHKHCLFGFLSVFTAFAMVGQAQSSWFADGYHGGVFGHYPQWKTQFLMDKMTAYPDWRVHLEIEPETYDSVRVWNPKTFLDFQTFVAANDHKSLEFTNPTFSQPYCYNISGESLIRQFSYGIEKLTSLFPNLRLTTYCVEEPCFTSSLPQLLRSFGFSYAVLKNPDTCFGGYTRAFGGELVNWVGPDGTTMVTSPRYACEKLAEKSTWQTIAWNNSKDYVDACYAYGIRHPMGMCYQDAGWKNGPWLGDPKTLSSNYSLWTTYFDSIADKASATHWALSQEDVQVSLMWGAQVLQKLAQSVRKTENKLVQTEKLMVLAQINAKSTWSQELFDAAWRGLMLSQHHDCWIVPLNRLESNHLTWAQNVHRWTGESNQVCNGMLAELTQTSNKSLSIVNTLGLERNELVECTLRHAGPFCLVDERGKTIPHQLLSTTNDVQTVLFKAKVPAMGTAGFRLIDKEPTDHKALELKQLDKNRLQVETDVYRMVLDASKGGSIVSLWDKQLKKEWADVGSGFGLNELRGYLTDKKNRWSSLDAPAEIRILEQGPLRYRIQISGAMEDQPYTQTLVLSQGERRIDCRLEIDWKKNVAVGEPMQDKDAPFTRKNYYDDRYKLHLVFPVAVQKGVVSKNAPFDVCQSKLENTFFNRWDSIKNNVILNWVDVHDTKQKAALTLLTDHTTSYLQGKDYPLGLTVQYSGAGLWGADYRLTEKTDIRYALFPHRGDWAEADISYENARFNEPLIPLGSSMFPSLLELSDKSLTISGLYFKDNKLYLRLYNEGQPGEKKLRLNVVARSVTECNLKEETIPASFNIKTARRKTVVNLPMPTFAIRTLCIQL